MALVAAASRSRPQGGTGRGVQGRINGKNYAFIQDNSFADDGELTVVLLQDGTQVAKLYFEAPLYPESPATISKLQSEGASVI